jgi:hypothetical protein
LLICNDAYNLKQEMEICLPHSGLRDSSQNEIFKGGSVGVVYNNVVELDHNKKRH